MHRTLVPTLLLVSGLAGAGCDSPLPTDPGDSTPPEQIVETFAETLTINGARTHPFAVQRPGTITAKLTSVTPDTGAAIGLSLGTWNGVACQIVIANDNATVGVDVVGTATATGNYCVRIYDVGRLSQAVDYTITVTHF